MMKSPPTLLVRISRIWEDLQASYVHFRPGMPVKTLEGRYLLKAFLF